MPTLGSPVREERTEAPSASGSGGGAGAGEEVSAALRSTFGFDRPEDGWFAVVRQATAPCGPGRLGPYEVLGEIGRGAQGTVFKAVQPGTQRIIAVKRLAAGAFAGAAARSRFEREVETASSLAHPGIVTVFGTDTLDGQPVLLMEWVDGEPIDRWARGSGAGSAGDAPQSLPQRLALFAQVCDAVAHAHQRGVLHRDLKPSNILVDRQSRPRVLDFGLAKLIGDAHSPKTLSHASADPAVAGEGGGGLVGTPAFAAPEQLTADPAGVDTRTDVYALGVVLYLLLTDRLPFDHTTNLPALLDAVRDDQPRRPSLANPALDAELDAIVLTALAKEPARRYQSADALAADVRRYLTGQIVLAHPPSTAYYLRKLVARHRTAFMLGATAVLAVAALAVVSSILAAGLASRGRELSAALSRAQEAQAHADEQAQVARDAQQHAQADAARSAASAEFLQSMLDSLGRAATAGEAHPDRTMLRETRARLEAGELADQPELEVSCWRRLASAALKLSMVGEAQTATQRATQLCEACLGPAHTEMGYCLLLQGLLAENRQDVALAESLYRRSGEVFTANLGPGSDPAILALNNVGCVLKDEGRYAEALDCHRAALDAWTRLYGPVHERVAMSLRNLGTLMRAQRKLDEAERYYRAALGTAVQCCAPTNQITMGIRVHLAMLASDQGRLDEAETGLREGLAILDGLYGKDGVELAHPLVLLGEVLGRQKRPADAAAVLARALELQRGHLPPDHPEIAKTCLRYAEQLSLAGRCAEAESVLRAAADLCARCSPPMPRRAQRANELLIACLRRLERNDEADRVAAQIQPPAPAGTKVP
jgi:serine/threonine protein kinase/tetratricopeptide (TPR) repeat protein